MSKIQPFQPNRHKNTTKLCKDKMFTNVKKSVENVKKSLFLFFFRITIVFADKFFTCIAFFDSFSAKLQLREYSAEYSSGLSFKFFSFSIKIQLCTVSEH